MYPSPSYQPPPQYPDQPVSIPNPSTPFSTSIVPKPGRLYTINGVAFSDCQRFSINFFVNGNDGDCGLHIDYRFDENVVVRNSRIKGNWEREERTSGLPMNRGVPFEMMILVERCRYMIACNGRHFAEFAHRIPLSLINTLIVGGQLNISQYRENTVNTAIDASLPRPLNPRYVDRNQLHVYDIPGGFANGRTLHIIGISRKGTFCCDFLPRDDSKDTPLHISCRIQEGVIVFNSMENSRWQAEVRPLNFRIFPHQHFLLEIQSHPHEYRLLINGVSTATFPIRCMRPEYIQVLSVSGDIEHRYVACT